MRKVRNYITVLLCITIGISGLAQSVGTPPAPENLRAELIKKGQKQYVRLTWDAKKANDTLTYGYYVFNNFPPRENMYLNGRISLIIQNTTDFEVKGLYGAEYKFAVVAQSAFPDKVRSERSKEVTIITPSKKLPLVKIKEVSRNQNKLTVKWDYRDIRDLQGFHIYLNDKIMTATPVDGNSYTLTIPEEVKKKMYVQMKAVSFSGVESQLTTPFIVKGE